MSNLKLLYKILRLNGMKITEFWFRNRNKELHLAVKPYKNGCSRPQCGRRGKIVRQTSTFRCWEDLTLSGLKVLFWYAPMEIECPTHVRMQETIPLAPTCSRITYRLEWRLCTLCQIMTQKAAAGILQMAPSTQSDLLHRLITRVRQTHKIRGLVTLYSVKVILTGSALLWCSATRRSTQAMAIVFVKCCNAVAEHHSNARRVGLSASMAALRPLRHSLRCVPCPER